MKRVLTPYVTQGGGAKSFNVNSLIKDMTGALLEIEFSIPPYYALVGRALITLEGIALIGDPNYKMVMEAYPYVADRILSEKDSPALRKALADILYNEGSFSASRLVALIYAALGVIATDSDSFISLDTLPKDSSSLEDVIKFVVGEDAEALREALLPEVVTALDIFTRRATNRSVQGLRNSTPSPLRGGLELALPLRQMEETCELSQSEEIYLESLVDFASEVAEFDVRSVLDNPLNGLSRIPQLGQRLGSLSGLGTADRSRLVSFGEEVTRRVASKGMDRLLSVLRLPRSSSSSRSRPGDRRV
eukprot:Plantae.Rhodophyta-Rhodochaete_pulchella.ctg2222.p1 GENE.Plantae.Rhodophyta-Rhodochaete_pulchella.ctg2222~~Plantae.Rhodophyta-Rhodochaete_pulchella.ctg2222.p1  ORF type:complete len:343 (-),score=54.56 Plantae.Rhodophyta-Rhodochaete_pulchella.ctg2222:447-1361(-)